MSGVLFSCQLHLYFAVLVGSAQHSECIAKIEGTECWVSQASFVSGTKLGFHIWFEGGKGLCMSCWYKLQGGFASQIYLIRMASSSPILRFPYHVRVNTQLYDIE